MTAQKKEQRFNCSLKKFMKYNQKSIFFQR
jgi:hypothetical protein